MKGGASCVRVVRSVFLSHCDRFARPPVSKVNVFLDFENAAPSEAEMQLFAVAEELLQEAETVLEDINAYGDGASSEIRIAIQRPNDKNAQQNAFVILDGLAQRIRRYYELSTKIEQIFPPLLSGLCSGTLPPAEQIDSSQATCRQFARLIDFVLLFDSLKMRTPALQNDFSFYRRSMSREVKYSFELLEVKSHIFCLFIFYVFMYFIIGKVKIGGPYSLSLELANTISLFLANPTPMLTALTTAACRFIEGNGGALESNATSTLATIVQVCQFMVETEENWERLSEYHRLFTVRLMVGTIILFDHIDRSGAFCKDSLIDIKSVVETLKAEFKPDLALDLLNSLRYNAKHLNDTSTPKSIRTLFP
uniref:CYRIA-B_Rac1-bd domain-containing protein n=1 Tax=Syphacia muris TaxID=451379 RepID=A0A158R4Q3_9BILA